MFIVGGIDGSLDDIIVNGLGNGFRPAELSVAGCSLQSAVTLRYVHASAGLILP